MTKFNLFERACTKCGEKFLSAGRAIYCFECKEDVVNANRRKTARLKRERELKNGITN